ncbi:hypothetical protein CTAYLR_003018 [Chrysophaeum taylorii]|uniref:MYND-type domain-containing protein n=1 Tax=Chrysophaeum taylorii TaxID=2483200 RepID=A0AAD7U6Y4_9STRA|nr:hypothetical protein CTAYLR_003018 [Chrysophaeum taylorii]
MDAETLGVLQEMKEKPEVLRSVGIDPSRLTDPVYFEKLVHKVEASLDVSAKDHLAAVGPMDVRRERLVAKQKAGIFPEKRCVSCGGWAVVRCRRATCREPGPSQNRCDICYDVAKFRCSKCRGLWFCGRECFLICWKKKMHKHWCSELSKLKKDEVAALGDPGNMVDDALERVLLRVRGGDDSSSEAPADARCWICLCNDGRLLSGCGCRGSAGWVHLECLSRHAATRCDENKSDEHAMCAWKTCITCGIQFVGELQAGMARDCWRYYARKSLASDPDPIATFLDFVGNARDISETLQMAGEPATAILMLRSIQHTWRKLFPNASRTQFDVNLVFSTVRSYKRAGAHASSIGLLYDILPLARSLDPLYSIQVLQLLADSLEKLEDITPAVAYSKESYDIALGRYGRNDPFVCSVVSNYAELLANVGKLRDARRLFEENLPIQRRLVGSDHPDTRRTQSQLDILGAAAADALKDPALERMAEIRFDDIN